MRTDNPSPEGFNAMPSDLDAAKSVRTVHFASCATHSATPRKHAQPEPTETPGMSVTLGHGVEDRIVNLQWCAGDIDCQVGISVATLRRMIEAGESYKPGAVL